MTAWDFWGIDKDVGHNPNPKTVVVVPVVRIVPVAVGTAGVFAIIVERAAPQHARVFGQAPHIGCGSS